MLALRGARVGVGNKKWMRLSVWSERVSLMEERDMRMIIIQIGKKYHYLQTAHCCGSINSDSHMWISSSKVF